MKFKVRGSKVEAVSHKLDTILESLHTSTVKRKKAIRIDEELCNSDVVAVVRMRRTEFGVLIESVSESFTNMTGVPRKELEGKYLHHVTGGSREADFEFCDRIDAKGAYRKEQPFNGLVLEGLILKEEDGVYTELLYLK